MAFGDQKGSALTGSENSIPNPIVAAGSVSVAVGDLVVGIVSQQTNLTATTTITDNLGNTYSFVNAGLDSGTITGRCFYARVTVAGTLTAVNVPTSSSTNDASIVAAVIEGPFQVSPLSSSPPGMATDSTTPFDCPSSGTLDKADAVVVGFIAYGGNATVAATSPDVLAGTVARANASSGLSKRVVSATTAVAPQFTGTSATCTVGTAAFLKADVTTVSQATITPAGKSIAEAETVAVSAATITLTGQTVNEVYPNVAQATITLTGQTVTPTDTSPPVTGDSVTVTAATIWLNTGIHTDELREDGDQELREDGGRELREVDDGPNIGEAETVTSASIATAGQSVADRDTISVSAASITLSGQTVNEVYPNVDPATITLSGRTILESETVAVSQATITLTGGSVTEALTVGSGTITVSGQSVVVSDNEIVGSAAITLSGGTITFIDGEIVAVVAASITLSGRTVVIADNELVGAASIALSGQDVTTSDTTGADTVTVSAATITVAGQSVVENDVVLVGGPCVELREDGGLELREDGGLEIGEEDDCAPRVRLIGQSVTTSDTVASDTTSVDPASIALTGRSVLANDTELVGNATVSLSGGTVTEAQNVDPATVTLTGRTVVVSDNELVGSTSLVLSGSTVVISDSGLVSSGTVTLAGGAILANDNELVGNATITLTGGDIVPTEGVVDSTAVDPATITLAGGLVIVSDIEIVSEATIILTGQDVALVETTGGEAAGGIKRHPRWPYVEWHLKDKCWKRVEDCPPELEEEMDEVIPTLAPLAPEEIRRLVGTLSALVPPPEFREEDDLETVALIAALED